MTSLTVDLIARTLVDLHREIRDLRDTLDRVRELRDASYVHPDGYIIDRASLDELLEADQ